LEVGSIVLLTQGGRFVKVRTTVQAIHEESLKNALALSFHVLRTLDGTDDEKASE
jgi:hypothetical protein